MGSSIRGWVFRVLLAAIALFALAPAAANAGVITPTVFTDDFTVNGNCTLREAIKQSTLPFGNVDACTGGRSSTSDQILLAAGTYELSLPDSGGEDGDLQVLSGSADPELTITGDPYGSTIDANGIDRVIEVRGLVAELVIEGVTITGGSSAADGGGIRVTQGASLELRDSVVTGNSAAGNGGGIQVDAGTTNDGARLDMQDSLVTLNDAADNGGGIHAIGTGLVEIDRSTISRNESGDAEADGGGGVYSEASFVLIDDSLITRNEAPGLADGGGVAAGGIAPNGLVVLTNTTVSTNSAHDGGGIHRENSSGTTSFRNLTVAWNWATQAGGGLANEGGTAFMARSILGYNTAPSGPDCSGTITSGGFTLFGQTSGCALNPAPGATGDITNVDPQLVPLAPNGGPTLTHALLSNSPAINASSGPNNPDEDQRGVPRSGTTPDIGAYERVLCGGVEVRFLGTDGADTLTGTVNADGILALGGNDTVDGGGGNDGICGGAGNDTLNGGTGNDTIDGEGGIDTLNGGTGNDTMNGGTEADSINGDSGDDTIGGGSGNDNVDGGADDDSLDGGTGNDTMNGGTGNDALDGHADNDTLIGGAGVDKLTGGGATDTADYSGAASGAVVSLDDSVASNDGDGSSDSLITEIENLTGSPQGDTLEGDGASNTIAGGGGGDQIDGRAGNDILDGGAGDDTLVGAAGQDALTGGAGTGDTADYSGAPNEIEVSLNDGEASIDGNGSGDSPIGGIENLTGSPQGDTLEGDGADNSISGGGGDDQIAGLDGDDTLNGGAGDDALDGGADSDTLDGGADSDKLVGAKGDDDLNGGTGTDTADYSANTSAITVNAPLDTVTDDSIDTLNDTIERFEGSPQNDTFSGADNRAEHFVGNGGTDKVDYSDAATGVTIDLGAGNASVGGGAVDTLVSIEDATGSDQVDSITGSSGPNVLFGLAGDDTLLGGAGVDQLNGGGGTGDTADYSGAADGVGVSLADGEASNDGDGSSDSSIVGIENLTGSPQGDTLEGDGASNAISGGGGGDQIAGLDGDDVLNGGPGSDTADYSTNTAAITVDTPSATVTDDSTDTLADAIEGFEGSPLNDTFEGTAARAELFDGNAGTDAVDYAEAPAGITLDLGAGSATDDGGGATDALVSIEDATGSDHADSLTGSSVQNALFGLAGDDTLNSQDGGVADTLDCGPHDTGDTANLDVQDTDTNCETLNVPAAGEPGGPSLDTTAPTLSGVKVTKRFSATRKKTAIRTAVSVSRIRKGGVIFWRLDEAAEVRIAVQKKGKGIRIKVRTAGNPGKTVRRCVKKNSRNKKALYKQRKAKSRKQRNRALRKASCARFSQKGKALKRSGNVGRNRTSFSGRIGNKSVGRGTFRVVLVATNEAGNASKRKASNGFKIVKPKKRK